MDVYWCMMFARPLEAKLHLLPFIMLKDKVVGFSSTSLLYPDSSLSLPSRTTVESSAYLMKLLVLCLPVELWISGLNDKGPRTQPWGEPGLTEMVLAV